MNASYQHGGKRSAVFKAIGKDWSHKPEVKILTSVDIINLVKISKLNRNNHRVRK